MNHTGSSADNQQILGSKGFEPIGYASDFALVYCTGMDAMGARGMLRCQASLAIALATAMIPHVAFGQEAGFSASPVSSGSYYPVESAQESSATGATPGILNQGGVNSSFGQSMANELGATGTAGDQDLATKLVDPTASVTTLNFQNRYISSFYGNSNQQNTLVFQPVIPYKAFGTNHIFRATMPYRLDGPFQDGLDPVTLFDLMVIPLSRGRLGVGPVVSFGPNNRNGRDTIQAGPAIGYVTQKGKWTLGGFNQNLISNDTNVSFLQPVIAYTINPKWTISAGDLQEGYDWKSDQWVSLPVGFQVGRLVQVGKTTLRLAYNPQYNFRDLDGNPEWTHLFGVGLVVK
jgi:hypothetical protein